jgi:cell filamentation protein
LTPSETEGSFIDPYVYPGTTVLRNLLDLRTQEDLDAVEYELTYVRRVELDRHPIANAFDFGRLKETHRRLFQDVYEWAGIPRTVNISKGESDFLPSTFIDRAAEDTFAWLRRSGLIASTVDDDSFVRLAADLLEKINYMHPFRDGNGRTQRAFLDQVAALSGHSLSWRNVGPEEHLRASVNAFRDGNGEAFRTIIRQAMRPPIDGLSRLDPTLYAVSQPMTVTPARPKTITPVTPKPLGYNLIRDDQPDLELG